MIRIVLGAKAREAGNTPSRPVGGEGLQGCVAGLGITDEGRLRNDDLVPPKEVSGSQMIGDMITLLPAPRALPPRPRRR
jgi:hypothetical protein